MKKLLHILLLLPAVALAQTNMNYVRTLTYREATSASDSAKARRSIVYYDALGRPIQQIEGKMSNESKDIITHIEYDDYGRQPKQYMPYAASTDNLMYVTDTIARQNTLSFYNSPYYENTPNPYTQSFFEASPLNRVLKQAAPGEPWQAAGLMGDDTTVKFAYKNNLANEVKRFVATADWNSSTEVFDEVFNDNGYYGIAQLYKTITTDENGINTEEFKNQLGQVVLKRAYEGTEKFDTYYVYDQYGNLAFVLPPLAEGQLSEGLCYYYKYDQRNRLVEKKLPGKQWEYIIYDIRDRVVATGPALSPFGVPNTEGWLYTYYEGLDRPAFTGWLPENGINSQARKVLQAGHNGDVATAFRYADSGYSTIDNINIGYLNRMTVNPSFKLLTVNYYDWYVWPGGPSTPAATSQVFDQFLMRFPKGMAIGSWARVLTDENGIAGDMSYSNFDTKGRVVRTRTINYMGGDALVNSRLDFDGTLLQTHTSNRKSPADNSIEAYDFFTYTPQDRLLKHTHQIGSGGPVELMSLNTYDPLGQLISKKVGGADLTGAAALQKIDFSYNIRGWLKGINDVAQLNQSITENDLFAFKINYTDAIVDNPFNNVKQLYNGNIAETYWRSASDNVKRKYGYSYDQLNRLKAAYYQKPDNCIKLTNSYNENLTYDKNGNILTLQRTGDYDDAAQAIGIDNLAYNYDTTLKNRLAKVTDSTNSPSGFKDSADNDEDDYTYDLNGNMLTDRNKGITSIRYNHMNLPMEIVFEGNANKKINYLYNAAGIKRRKTVARPNKDPNILLPVTLATDYLDGFHYADGILQYFPTAEGYVDVTRKSSNGYSVYNYVYQYKDHLGNIRMNYAWDPAYNVLKIKEESHYYPFGLKHTNYNGEYLQFQEEQLEEMSIVALSSSNPQLPPTFYKAEYKYKYNGKELQNELGLNMYDYGARNYDPAIGRWINIDPLAETSRRWGTYTYAYNNPMYFVDPDGRQGEDYITVNHLTKTAHFTRTNSTHDYVTVTGSGGTNSGFAQKGLFKLEELVAEGYDVTEAYAVGSGLSDWAGATFGGGKILSALYNLISNFSTTTSTSGGGRPHNTTENSRNTSAPNPHGSKGKPDHQAKVKELEKRATEENPGKDIVTEKKIQVEGSRRRPDVQAVDKETGRTTKIYEAERNPNSARNKAREAEYDNLGIPHETHKVGN